MKYRILCLAVAALFFLTACSTDGPAETAFTAMDTYVSIRCWGDEALLDEVRQTIVSLESLLSVTDSESEIFQLNQNGSAALSAQTQEVLEQALSISARTDGAFDPTVYPMVQAWGFTTETNRVPDAEALAALIVGTSHLHLEQGRATLDAGAAVDLGGIAKGYTSQVCAELLAREGVTSAILVLGGNVQTLGSKPDGSDWLVGISDPDAPSDAIAKLHFTGSLALVTSGGYQRYFEADGIRYHHIIDPQTGFPAETGLRSVTILAENGTLADALSTALYVMGPEAAIDFWRSSDDFEAVLILDDGSILATEGAAPLLYDCEFTTVCR